MSSSDRCKEFVHFICVVKFISAESFIIFLYPVNILELVVTSSFSFLILVMCVFSFSESIWLVVYECDSSAQRTINMSGSFLPTAWKAKRQDGKNAAQRGFNHKAAM